jgi:hypothetical protein
VRTSRVDALGRINQVTEHNTGGNDGATPTVSFTYYPSSAGYDAGQLQSVTVAGGPTRTYGGYDALGRPGYNSQSVPGAPQPLLSPTVTCVTTLSSKSRIHPSA